jgi:GntR family transcriptional regulator
MPAATPVPVFEPIAPEAAGMPLYRVVKRALLRAVASGACAPGSALPSESELAASLAVSIGTLRKAVDELAAEHIVVRRQGRGTFVATHTADRLLFQFFPLERDDGRREAPRVEWLSFERARAAGDAARRLALREGEPVLQIESSVSLQGAAVLHERLTLPAALFKGLSEKRLRDWPGTLYQLYQAEFGVTVVRALERARAIGADRATARVLGLAPAAPVLQVRRTALSFGDRPVEYRVSLIDTTHHDYVNELARAAQAAPGASA